MKTASFRGGFFLFLFLIYFDRFVIFSFLAIRRGSTTDASFFHRFIFPDMCIREFLFFAEEGRNT